MQIRQFYYNCATDVRPFFLHTLTIKIHPLLDHVHAMNTHHSPISGQAVRLVYGFLLLLLLSACGGGGGGTTAQTQPAQLSGKTSFVSADRYTLDMWLRTAVEAVNVTATDAKADSSTRAIVQGDIYRVLDAGKYLLNLNSTRGLQIIDLSDPAKPFIAGRTAMSGRPVEMYSVGEHAYILMDNWSEYKRVQKDGQELLDVYHGAVVVTVDISQRSAPKIVATTRVGNYISASRLSSVTGASGSKHALYIAAHTYNNVSADVVLKSFAIDGAGNLKEVTSLSLGGYARAMQAAGDKLMVANYRYNNNDSYSEVSVVDIASPDGVMVQGGSVRVAGVVQQKHNMHIEGNVMRIVSGSSWGLSATASSNHVETFNIADIKNPVAIDHDRFGEGQQLFATYFMADRAFFVTYLRKDPFHAFSISPDGMMKEESEFIVSGWNDFFVPVSERRRLLGVGHNDENNSRKLAISLYDVTNLTNKQPMLARAEIDLSHSWSEANWDDRAFTVLETATDVLANDGKTRETGLVLLPFVAWDATSSAYQSGVQIFSFSDSSVTRRGVMQQDTQVARSIVPDHSNLSSALALNISASELSVFGLQNLQTPVAKSRLSLVSNFTQFLVMNTPSGQVGVRYRAADFSWWGTQSTAQRQDSVELVALNDADRNPALATIKVPEGSAMYAVEDKLVLVSTKYDDKGTLITVLSYDISNPAAPKLLSQFSSDQIVTTNNYALYDKRICIAGRCVGVAAEAKVVGNNLVFVSQSNEISSDTSKSVRFISTYGFHVLSLADASKPVLHDKLSMAKDENTVGIVQSSAGLWVNYNKSQAELSANGEAMAKYFVKALTLSSSGKPQLGKEINIPGELMAVQGEQLFTIEYNWKAKTLEPSLHMLILNNDLAYLQASLNLAGQSPTKLLVDGSKVFLNAYDDRSYQYQVSVLQLNGKDFVSAAKISLGDYVELSAAQQSKLLLQNGYGVFVYDISKLDKPVPQAYFAANAWNGKLSITGEQIFMAAGAYGIYQFNFATVNL